jgi:tRNA(adenine34) deaminase
MEEHISDTDRSHLNRAIQLALEAEENGNLPIGCVISFDGMKVAEGKNAMWVPDFNPIRHAEIEALMCVPRDLWEDSHRITIYSTLEPCLMCTAAILQHGVGKVIFGSSDDYGGVRCVLGHMPPYFEEKFASVQWLGPVLPKECDPLFQRAIEAIERRRRPTN